MRNIFDNSSDDNNDSDGSVMDEDNVDLPIALNVAVQEEEEEEYVWTSYRHFNILNSDILVNIGLYMIELIYSCYTSIMHLSVLSQGTVSSRVRGFWLLLLSCGCDF